MPYTIIEIEITQPLPTLVIPEGYNGIALVARRKDIPIGFLIKELLPKSILSNEDLAQILGNGINQQLIEDNHFLGPTDPSYPKLDSSLSIAICTKDNPKELANCLKRLFDIQTTVPETVLEVLVIDNASSDDRTKEVVTSFAGVHYIREPKPGLNFARNRAVQEATGEIIAFVDDDVTVDRYWVKGLAKALAEHPDAAAFTGLVLPTELETDAQILFEKRGGFEKSFKTIRYGQSLPGHPFYPCVGGKFGTGCNMAFRRKVLLDLGGFDEALDTGATLPGGGDTDMLYRVVRTGYPLIYEPQFLAFHRHRREYKKLCRQYSRSWAQGLMAFVVKSYKNDIAQRPNLRRLVLWWFDNQLHDLQRSLKGNHVLSPKILLAELWGAAIGLLIAYPRSLKRAARIQKEYSNHV